MLLSEGIRAYTDLDFAAAAQLLRRALDPADSARLSPSDRLRALMYLGAANVFREDHDEAVAVFRTLVLADPRLRPDSLVFPPRVAQTFAEVLQTTKAVGLVAPEEARFPAGSQGLAVRAYATSRHRIEAQVTAARGNAVATLYRGPIADSVTLAWDGLDSTGTRVAPGRYDLIVTSLGHAGPGPAQHSPAAGGIGACRGYPPLAGPAAAAAAPLGSSLPGAGRGARIGARRASRAGRRRGHGPPHRAGSHHSDDRRSRRETARVRSHGSGRGRVAFAPESRAAGERAPAEPAGAGGSDRHTRAARLKALHDAQLANATRPSQIGRSP